MERTERSPRLGRRTLLGGVGVVLASPFTLGGCAANRPTATVNEVLRLPGQRVGVPSPFLYQGGVGYLQASYVYDTLMWKDLDGSQIPWLARSHKESSDGITHTYQLRETTWSDGEQFTAADVVFSFTYLDKHRKSVSPNVVTLPRPGLIQEVAALDEHTVQFTLARPDWTFNQTTGAGAIFIMPEHIWSKIDDPAEARSLEALVGTGPYRITDMDPSTGAYRYEAREDFFGGSPLVKVIEHRPVSDPLAALTASEIDQAGGVGPGTGLRPQVVQPFRTDRFVVVEDSPQTVTALYFNLAKGGPLADVKFRRAVARAINRGTMVEKALGGGGSVASSGLIPAAHPQHVDVEPYGFDVEQAERELRAAGYERPDNQGPRLATNGQPLSFRLLLSAAQPKEIAELVAADLGKIGIGVRIEIVDLPTFGQRRLAGDTELSINTFGGIATDEQPDGLGKVYGSGSRSLQSAQGYLSPEFDKLLSEQRAEMDPVARARISGQMQRVVAHDLPIFPLVYPPLVTINAAGSAPKWAYTPGGVGGLVPSVNNKVAFIAGVPE